MTAPEPRTPADLLTDPDGLFGRVSEHARLALQGAAEAMRGVDAAGCAAVDGAVS